jgi:hypothetical protein
MTDIKVEETTEYESCLDFQADDYADVNRITNYNTFNIIFLNYISYLNYKKF